MPTTADLLLTAPDRPPRTPPMPTLSITPRGILHLHASLREQLALRYGQPIDLYPPGYNEYFWYLDLRATAARRVQWNKNTRPRAEGIILPPGLVTAPLTLHLHTLTPEYPDYYPLLPVHALATQSPAPPLAAHPGQ